MASKMYDPSLEIASTDQSARDVATQIIARQIAVARQREPDIIADRSVEALHAYRVDLRKIRAALSLFEGVYLPSQTDDLKARFSDLMAQTGPLRDLDVFLSKKQSFADGLPDSLQGGLDALFALRATERSAAQTALARQLESPDHAQSMRDLAKMFSAPGSIEPGPRAHLPIQKLICTLIWKQFKKTRKIADDVGPDSTDDDLHTLRIQCKKLRYLLEFSGGLLPTSSLKAAIKTLKSLQTRLGLLNDLSVQIANVQAFMQGAIAWPESE